MKERKLDPWGKVLEVSGVDAIRAAGLGVEIHLVLRTQKGMHWCIMSR